MKYLAVDLGNVMCEVDFNPFLIKLSKLYNISTQDALDLFLTKTQKPHDLGLINISDELRDYFKIKSDVILTDLMKEWDDAIKPNIYMNNIINNLIKNNIKVALLSNIGAEHASIMKKVLSSDVYDNSIKFFSYQVGARKPTYLYYKTFLDMYPEFKGCVYLDDRPENIEAGWQFGFNAIEFSLEKILKNNELVKTTNDIVNIILA